MDSTKSKARLLVVLLFWFFILGTAVFAYRWWFVPRQQEKAEQAAVQSKLQTIEKTSAPSRYRYTVRFTLDSFSGYALVRSADFRDEVAKSGGKLELKDDQANYPERLKMLADGKADMAMFTLDALIKACANIGDIPATVVCVVDETKGADAMLGSAKAFPNIDALNDPATHIVCVENSPSETLARVVMAYFQLDRMAENPFVFVDSADAVYDAYKKASPTEKKVFVTWEPYVSRIVTNPDYRDLVNSAKFRGYIVDVIVANRSFLVKNEDIAETIVKAYLTTAFNHRKDLEALVLDDAKQLGEALKPEQAKKLVETIWWKNTQENFGHFGLVTGQMQHLDTICTNITDVLLKTKAIREDPTQGRPNLLYYDGIMKRLHDNSWYPGFGQETVRQEKSVAALSDEEWQALRPVGTLQVPRLVFARGTSQLVDASFGILDDLADKLTTWPLFYIAIESNVASSGDPEANRLLADARGEAVMSYLVTKSINRDRMKVIHGRLSESSVRILAMETNY